MPLEHKRRLPRTIVEAHADYVLSCQRESGPSLKIFRSCLRSIRRMTSNMLPLNAPRRTTNKGHGRIDIRECWSTSEPATLNLIRDAHNWVGLKVSRWSLATRIVAGKETKTIRFYISSLQRCPKHDYCTIVRRHWSNENELHWVLDVAFNEDHSRVRKDQAPENFAVLAYRAQPAQAGKNCQRRHPRQATSSCLE